jgi:hypothetical protein
MIRVANRFDEDGGGWSGPCYEDQMELDWDDIGVPPELTSVSKKIRRVFTFSERQVAEAMLITGCTDIFLGFINYLPTYKQRAFIEKVRPTWVGYDKTINDIVPVEEYGYDKTWVKI